MQDPRGIPLTTSIGTIALLAGVIVTTVNWDRYSNPHGFLLGALLVIAGLLLRIEGAITRLRRRL